MALKPEYVRARLYGILRELTLSDQLERELALEHLDPLRKEIAARLSEPADAMIEAERARGRRIVGQE